MSRLEAYRNRLKVQQLLDTMSTIAHCVENCSQDGQSKKMFNLADRIYKEHFASKKEKQQFGCFVAYCISIFESNLK